MNDAGVGRNDAEVVERVLSPPKKRVALLVARELQLGVQLERVGLSEVVHLHGVIDHELDGLQRVDAVRVAAQPRDAVAHRCQIDDRGNAREVLQQHARRGERDFLLRAALEVPPRERFDVGRLDETSVFVPEQVLQQDFHRVGQARDAGKAGFVERREAVDLNGAAAHWQRGPRAEAVHGRHVDVLKTSIVPHGPNPTVASAHQRRLSARQKAIHPRRRRRRRTRGRLSQHRQHDATHDRRSIGGAYGTPRPCPMCAQSRPAAPRSPTPTGISSEPAELAPTGLPSDICRTCTIRTTLSPMCRIFCISEDCFVQIWHRSGNIRGHGGPRP